MCLDQEIRLIQLHVDGIWWARYLYITGFVNDTDGKDLCIMVNCLENYAQKNCIKKISHQERVMIPLFIVKKHFKCRSP